MKLNRKYGNVLIFFAQKKEEKKRKIELNRTVAEHTNKMKIPAKNKQIFMYSIQRHDIHFICT